MAVSRGKRSRKARIEPMWFVGAGATNSRGVVLVQQGEHSFFIWDRWGTKMTWEQTEDCQFCVDRFTHVSNYVVASDLDAARKHLRSTYEFRTPTYDEARIIEDHRSEINNVFKEIGNKNFLLTTLWTQAEINDEMAWALDGGKLTETPKSFRCSTLMVADW